MQQSLEQLLEKAKDLSKRVDRRLVGDDTAMATTSAMADGLVQYIEDLIRKEGGLAITPSDIPRDAASIADAIEKKVLDGVEVPWKLIEAMYKLRGEDPPPNPEQLFPKAAKEVLKSLRKEISTKDELLKELKAALTVRNDALEDCINNIHEKDATIVSLQATRDHFKELAEVQLQIIQQLKEEALMAESIITGLENRLPLTVAQERKQLQETPLEQTEQEVREDVEVLTEGMEGVSVEEPELLDVEIGAEAYELPAQCAECNRPLDSVHALYCTHAALVIMEECG